EALKKGAYGVIVERDCGVENQIIVPNTVEFLGQLASKIVKKSNGRIVAITGSNGKTTTKEIVSQVLASEIPTFKNEGNLNTEIGLPLSIINSYKGEPILVLEMAQRIVGDIEYLCNIFPPELGVLLNVGSAHAGVAGNLENIFKGKWQIVEKSKQALVNYDDERMRCEKCRYFGLTGGNYVLKKRIFDGKKTILSIEYEKQEYIYQLPGYWTKPMSLSFLVAFAVADILDVLFNPISLINFKPLKGRFNIYNFNRGYIIDDSYNASYESFKAGVEELLEYFPKPRYAVVGAMKELGNLSTYYHKKLSELLEILDGVLIYDKEPESLDISPSNTLFRSSEDNEIVNFLKNNILDDNFGGTIYFKASRALELEKIIHEVFKNKNK
ncbi:MAG: UDP-N-acetylmuramoyl-tripeptide--D-alanyl-D-alanine ligase, partial [Fervidobacterium sp.]